MLRLNEGEVGLTGAQLDECFGTGSSKVKSVVNHTWVATGPFSGCFVGACSGSSLRIAHLITKAHGYRAAPVDDQIAAIKKATGSTLTTWSMKGNGLGLAFFMMVAGSWLRRFVWVGLGGNLLQIWVKSEPL